jgi:oligopeptidase B
MRKNAMFFIVLLYIIAGIQGCKNEQIKVECKPPVAKKIPKELMMHGNTRIDNYYWMNQREDTAVISYLKAENVYCDSMMKHTDSLQLKLYNEMVGRIAKDDATVPYKKNGYSYYDRTEGEAEYQLICRRNQTAGAKEEIMLNVPDMAKGFSFYNVGNYSVSTNNKLLAFSIDTISRRLYEIRFKNLETNEIYKDRLPNTDGTVTWANDNKTLFYVVKDTKTLLPNKVYRHTLGTNSSPDQLVYQEKDSTFYTYCTKTKSDKFIIIGLSSTLSSEYRILDADKPTGNFKVFHPREKEMEYSVEHFGNEFYIRTNDNAKNFRLMKTPITKTEKKNWVEVIPNRDSVFLSDFDIFKNYLAVSERVNGLPQMRIISWKDKTEHYIDFGEQTYSASFGRNMEINTDSLRYNYTSLTTPNSVFDYDMATKTKVLKKQQRVIGDFSPDNYIAERVFATASDGRKIPISLVYRKGLVKDGQNPLWITGYGSYGSSSDVYFTSSRLSLLDRGFIYVIAHIRGGQEMGRYWYEEGKLLNKMNTFTDFIACTEYLVQNKYTNPGKVIAIGGSAGGLLMGAIANMRPDLYKGIIAAVPFVDVVTTMLDASIPLTTGEYDEWGNPNKKEYYDYMLSYSPYDNVKAQYYSNMLVTTGLYDSQVQYFEPAKWVAKLRGMKTDKNQLIFKINMEFGHGGASGRFQRYKEVALEYAFGLNLLGIKQ